MAEYIEREALIEKCKAIIQDKWNDKAAPVSWSHAYADFIEDIENQPAADVAPVVHGQWVYNPNGMDWNLGAWQCSVCKCNNNNLPGNDKYNPYIFQGSNYCPNCGAKMDVEEHNDV